MKKVFGSMMALICMFMLAGCEKAKTVEGLYKEGTYMGSKIFESYGTNYVTTAVIYVGEEGKILSCYLDSTYKTEAGAITTKKTLGDDYNMKSTSANKGVIPGGAEWYEQAEQIEKRVLKEQNLDWVKWEDEAKTKLDVDVISGVTITADAYIAAISNALAQAKA